MQLPSVLLLLVVADPPAREMPEHLVDGYTMGGRIPTGKMFVDDTGPEHDGTHYRYNAESVQGFIDAAERVKGKGVDLRRDNKRLWLVEALKLHPFGEDAKVAVYGSMEPWYEAVALVHGAGLVETIEYNELTYTHPKISTKKVENCNPCGPYDAAISMSSFDHDGLGRYGDPLDPNGDLTAMKTTLSQLRPGGLLYLTVPVGPDVVVWNLHRRYGAIRLPLLLEGWEVVDRVGWDEGKLTAEGSWRHTFEPVFVLRKPGGGGDAEL